MKKTFVISYMTRDMSWVTKCDKIINKLISQLKLYRIQQNFKLKLPKNKLSRQNICDMLHDTWHVTCDKMWQKIINKLISQLKLNRIQQNFKLKLPNNKTVKINMLHDMSYVTWGKMWQNHRQTHQSAKTQENSMKL